MIFSHGKGERAVPVLYRVLFIGLISESLAEKLAEGSGLVISELAKFKTKRSGLTAHIISTRSVILYTVAFFIGVF
jgi:hypothetical protein